ncbi:gamma-secretase subunit Aph-1b-like isoform X2 [Accipiter gentilis]|uniref:gamma-secretase subunit Aph-1b-like isoform X2 n=1 Tax=Astur gentilis TaxID=8957 RepID=UPI00210F48BA|nr:gamma-secretase subunit Aph-1b-like isoform X2 [Accipiter gentilis]
MTLAIFFGCTFIAFGPVFSLFLFTIARDPLRIIVLIAGAFFWLVSLLLSSLIWFITVKASDPRDEPLQKGLLIFGVMFSVLLQEAFRFLYYKLLRKAIEGLVATLEQGKSLRSPPPEEEGVPEIMCDDLTATPIPCPPAPLQGGEDVEKIGSGVGRREGWVENLF